MPTLSLIVQRSGIRTPIKQIGPNDDGTADTIAAMDATNPLPAMPVDPPTLAMTFSINDSPLAGKEGDKVTTRMIRGRLMREAER